MLTLLLLNRNIINNLKIRKTELELPDGFKNPEDSFTTDQQLRSTDSTVLPKLRERRRKKEEKFHILHPNPISKRRNL
jgi:N-dimethylarginine dimethylaminohydrolase